MWNRFKTFIDAGFTIQRAVMFILNFFGISLLTGLSWVFTKTSYGIGPAMVAAVWMAAGGILLSRFFRTRMNNTRIKGSVTFGEIRAKSVGSNSIMSLELINHTIQDRFVKIEEVQGTSKCNPMTYVSLRNLNAGPRRVPANSSVFVDLDRMGGHIARQQEGGVLPPSKHKHYRIKISVGSNESELQSCAVAHFICRFPLKLILSDGVMVPTDGGGEIRGARYDAKPIANWPEGYGMTCNAA